MIIKEVKAKSILTRSKLPESDYCINPYTGCAHACVYCYARFMKRFTGHLEPWGEFVDIKINSVELLKKSLSAKRDKGGTVLLGSVTDAYQPIERKYELTRGILRELSAVGYSISILTKSDLVVRDIDILKELDDCTVGLSISIMDDDVRSKLEPRTASVERRITALRRLHDSGISTYAFIGPVLPVFTDLNSVFAGISGIVDRIMGESLNTRAGSWENIVAAVKKNYPDRLAEFKEKARSRSFWDGVEMEFRDLSDKYEVPLFGFYRH